ncbi:MAG: hypothetical protein H7A46_13985 [Verrucomicrobiales bacterium]|nr:hypothetical protein [Verrucomicrobiales bacterium]
MRPGIRRFPDSFELGSTAVDPTGRKVYYIQDQALVQSADHDGTNVTAEIDVAQPQGFLRLRQADP